MRWLKILAVQVLIGVLLLEVGPRIYNPIGARVRGADIVLPVKHVYRFDNGPGTKKLDRYTVHTRNTLGFRGPDPPNDFEERLTIVTVGGSTTESLFLSDGQTWTDEMSRRLALHFDDVWVNNAGLDGHTTYGHLQLLRSYLLKLRPKVVVFLIGANDVALDERNTFDAGLDAQTEGVRSFVNTLATYSEVASVALNFARAARARERGLGHSEVDLRNTTHLVMRPEDMAHTEAQAAASLPAYRARVEQLVALCREHDIHPVLVTQPALFGEGIDPATGVELATAQVSGRGNGRLEWRLLEQVNDVTRSVAAAHRVPLVELARELPKDSRFFYDFLHFTNEGSLHVGEIVAAGLLPYLREHFGEYESERSR